MAKQEIVIMANYAEELTLTQADVCEICHITPVVVQELIEYGIVQPEGERSSDWAFNLTHLARIKTSLRLQRDLEINLSGVALILDLLDEMRKLRVKEHILHKHYHY